MVYGGIIGQSFDDSVIKEYIDQQINELKQQISETSVKIATGSYVGTGKYGKNNPNSLTFDFTPKAVFIFGTKASNDTGSSMMYSWGDDSFTLIYASYSGASPSGTASVSGNTMSWYDTSKALSQCNQSSRTYNYLAIG